MDGLHGIVIKSTLSIALITAIASVTFGENGIIEKAVEIKEKTKIAQDKWKRTGTTTLTRNGMCCAATA